MKKYLKIIKMSTEHLDQYNKLLRYAFQVTEKSLLELGWEDEDIRQAKFPVLERAHVLGYFDSDDLLSQFAVYPMTMNIHSVIYPVGFITSVATYPEYTGMGLMSALMKQSLTYMKESGQTLALLYPYSIPLYRYRGWEIISDKMTYRINDTQLPKNIKSPGYVRRVTVNSEDLMNLHTEFAGQAHGCLFRDELAWEEYWRWEEDDTSVAIYYDFNDNPIGYVVYLIKDDIFYVKEMVYLNFEAFKGLMQYISAHESMVNEVRGDNYTSEPMAFLLPDSDIKETIRPYIMGRIVDIEGFMANYTFNKDIKNLHITFNINDPFLEWNNRSFSITINDGKAEFASETSTYAASMSIGTLTTLLLGYKSASELYRIEYIKASPDTIKQLDNAIIKSIPYISDYI